MPGFQSSKSKRSASLGCSGSPLRTVSALADLKGSSAGMRSSHLWCESFSWSEKSSRTSTRTCVAPSAPSPFFSADFFSAGFFAGFARNDVGLLLRL